MNDENFYLDKNKKKINIIGFKTFKDDFWDYDVKRQEMIKEKAKQLLDKKSEKRSRQKKYY